MEVVDFYLLFSQIPEVIKIETGGDKEKQGPPEGQSLTGEIGAAVMNQIIPKGKGEPPDLVKQIIKENKLGD